MSDFDINALFNALDAQRQSRGLSWQQARNEICRLFDRVTMRPISTSTITGMRSKSVIEGDGVLQMLRWLGRTPESFVPGEKEGPDAVLPHMESNRILRFDTRALHLALDARRIEQAKTWTQVAKEIDGVTAAMLTRLSKPGGRVVFPTVMRITRWLGQPAVCFTRIADR